MDYSNTFSPVAQLTSIQLFISLAATHGKDLYQLDIKNVFLCGDFLEEVYMEQPPELLHRRRLVEFFISENHYMA